MSFFAIFNYDFSPVDLCDLIKPHNDRVKLQVLGRTKQVMFIMPAHAVNPVPGEVIECVSLHKRLWLMGRVRLDARQELCSCVTDSAAALAEPDSLLCIRAYARWGEACLERLKGDFCFVLWDEDRQHLFCARDQLGVRPLFYANTANAFFSSDSIAYLAAQTRIPNELDNQTFSHHRERQSS
jgi:asparagine synthase (glutamine-hydrolysing)